jgi:serralysin
MSVFYSQDIFGNAILESAYYYDRNVKPLLDWFDADIFVSHDDIIYGGDLWFFDVFNGSDLIIGTKFRDIIRAGDSGDVLRGKGGNDSLYGERGDDILLGHAGDDKLRGGSGDDRLTGGDGEDLLHGGGGYDQFIFKDVDEIGRGRKCDEIVDFDPRKDYVNLKAVDANVHERGNQAFEFIGKSAFHDEAGELRCRGGKILGDVDGDGKADFRIDLSNGIDLTEVDFIL